MFLFFFVFLYDPRDINSVRENYVDFSRQWNTAGPSASVARTTWHCAVAHPQIIFRCRPPDRDRVINNSMYRVSFTLELPGLFGDYYDFRLELFEYLIFYIFNLIFFFLLRFLARLPRFPMTRARVKNFLQIHACTNTS